MRNKRLIVTVVTLVLLASSMSFAGTISEDVTYWFKTADGTGSMINPDTDWLKQNTDNLLVKIQQTVYDQISTASMLKRNNPNDNVTGFLYAYSVTNLNVGDWADLADMGIRSFHVDWSTSYFATVSHQTPTGWVVDSVSPAASSGPTWKWTPVDAGLLPGETVGGLWAVSNVGVDGKVTSSIVHLAGLGARDIYGTTTGPVPEPGSILSLLSGMAGLGMMVKLRRKK